MAMVNLMKWGERVFAETEEGGKELKRVMEQLVSQRVRERRRESRISWGGGKLVAQWGFLLEFNLSSWGRKGRREGRQGPAWVNSSMEYV